MSDNKDLGTTISRDAFLAFLAANKNDAALMSLVKNEVKSVTSARKGQHEALILALAVVRGEVLTIADGKIEGAGALAISFIVDKWLGKDTTCEIEITSAAGLPKTGEVWKAKSGAYYTSRHAYIRISGDRVRHAYSKSQCDDLESVPLAQAGGKTNLPLRNEVNKGKRNPKK